MPRSAILNLAPLSAAPAPAPGNRKSSPLVVIGPPLTQAETVLAQSCCTCASSVVAALYDAQQLDAMSQVDPAQATAAMASVVARAHDPNFARLLVAAGQPALERIVTSLDPGSDPNAPTVVDRLAFIAEQAGPQGAQTVADLLGVSPNLSGLLDPVIAAAHGGDGALLAERLGAALQSSQPTDAQRLDAEVASDAHQALDSFTAAGRKADLHEAVLFSLISNFGALFTARELVGGATALRAKYTAQEQDFQTSARQLASLLPALAALVHDGTASASAQADYPRALQLLPELGRTEAGKALMRQAVVAQAQGERTFLDDLNGAAKTARDPNTYRSVVASQLSVALGTEAILLAQTNGPISGQQLIQQGLLANASFIGSYGDTMMGTIDPLATMLGDQGFSQIARGIDQRSNYHRKYQQQHGAKEVPSANRVSAALRVTPWISGLMITFRALGNLQSWSQFGQQDTFNKALTVNGAVDVSSAAVRLALTSWTDASRFKRTKFGLGVINGLTNVLYSYADLQSAAALWHEGSRDQAVALGAAGGGEGLVAASAALSGLRETPVQPAILRVTQALGLDAEALPEIGTIVGTALMGLGFGAEFGLSYLRTQQVRAAAESDVEQFLRGTGLPPPAAQSLSRVDTEGGTLAPFLTQVAPYLNLPPAALMAQLARAPTDKLDALADMAMSLGSSRDRQGQVRYSVHPGDVGFSLEDLPIPLLSGPPRTLPQAAAWMRQQGLVQG